MATQKPSVPSPLTTSQYSKRVLLKTILERSDRGCGILDRRVVVGGWVKSAKKEIVEPGSNKCVSRAEKFQCQIPIFSSLIKVSCWTKSEPVLKQPPQSISILTVSDGSCVAGLRIAVDSTLDPHSQLLNIGTCILAEGTLKKPSTPGKRLIELIVEKILHIGEVDKDKYPLSTKGVKLEELRDWSQFRPRTTTVGSVTRIRSAMTFAVHSFFQNNGFFYVQLSTIIPTYAERFGEKFLVTTLDIEEAKKEKLRILNKLEGVDLDDLNAAVMEKIKVVEELKSTGSNEETVDAAIKDLQKTKELVSVREAREVLISESLKQGDNMKFSEDFFSRRTYLTVSGHLHLESYACALGNVYSCGPRFRADRIESSKQSAEMWMVEAEIAFSEMEDVIKCAVDLLKYLCEWVLINCREDMEFVKKRIDKTNIERLRSTFSRKLKQIQYTTAVEILNQNWNQDGEKKIECRKPLTTEQLSYLADSYYKEPLILVDYPKEVQPIYVRLNEDGKTAATFDIILPKFGKIISGSQNEERPDKLLKSIKHQILPTDAYEWCLQLRRNGTVKHSGFSLALDSFLVFATGLPDIRDAIPFPWSYSKPK